MVIRIVQLICLMFLCICTYDAKAELVINEVMSNEPGSQTSLEWIEIHNNSATGQFLGFFSLQIDGSAYSLPDFGVGPDEYFIICKNLNDYEGEWGDNSGVWGDNELLEAYSLFQINSFSLINGGGYIELVFGGSTISDLEWLEAGADGISWERISPENAEVLQCVHPSGSTPGKVNSITPLGNDLALVNVEIYPLFNASSYFVISIANIGIDPVNGGDLSFYYDPDSNQIVDQADLITVINYPDTFPGDTIEITTSMELDGAYPLVFVTLPDDNRTYNNSVLRRAFGVEFPPIIISEFVADPDASLGTEWVELYNHSDVTINLHDWFLGDGIKLNRITAQDILLDPFEYIVLCHDSSAMNSFYRITFDKLLEMPSWPTLNNSGDMIRLRDNNDIIVDSIIYDFTYGSNYSWALVTDSTGEEFWGRSVNVGGTPGFANDAYVQPEGTEISVTIDPNPFSPSYDNTTSISFENPPGENLILRIYNRDGRIVRTILDDVPSFNGEIGWDGADDEGVRLPVGIYILYLEISGVKSYKETIVIAP